MVVTSRALRTGTDAVDSLSIAAVVAAAMVSITRGVLDRTTPAWLLGKGGITSSDLVTRAAGFVAPPSPVSYFPAWCPYGRAPEQIAVRTLA